MLFRVTIGYPFWFNKEQFWLLKFPWTISDDFNKELVLFLNLLKRIPKNLNQKRFFIEPNLNGSKSHFWNHFGSVFYFFGPFLFFEGSPERTTLEP